MTDTHTATLARIQQHITDAAAAITAELDSVEDPVARQALAAEAQALLPELQRAVKAHRSATVAELKQGRTLAQVAEMIGGTTSLVDQILKVGAKK
ncbi:hypothetical protein AB0D49_08380 [Streptomyces sp. NPDC048290]|uniref:hypothetical protein n=1 Tax=Streptomyces sp. NPDC048290 TaxID=3155811 RepID=UPI0034213BD4